MFVQLFIIWNQQNSISTVTAQCTPDYSLSCSGTRPCNTFGTMQFGEVWSLWTNCCLLKCLLYQRS